MQLYVAWTRYQRRAESMKDFFNYSVAYMPGPKTRKSPLRLLVSYFGRAWRLLKATVTLQPEVLWIQAPPNFVIHLAWLSRLLSGGRMKLVADLHNAALARPWIQVPLTRRLLNTFDVILVHNEHVRLAALKAGLNPKVLAVLEDRVPRFEVRPPSTETGRPTVVMPCSFHADEPIEAVLATAKALPQVDFLITGDRAKAERLGYLKSAPENAIFTGFVATPAFNTLILDSFAVLCLTTRDGIQLSAASEALGAGKPMILSDTPLLRSLFGPAALFTDNSVESLRLCCLQAIVDYKEHAAATMALRSSPERNGRWLAQAENVRHALGV